MTVQHAETSADEEDRSPLWDDVTARDVHEETRRAVAAAFTAYDADEHADRDLYALTISSLGGCLRQAAYRLARVRPSDPDLAFGENRAAGQGTMQHKGLLPKLAAELDAAYEVPVTLRVDGDDIAGTLDLFGRFTVWDLKTVRENRLEKVASAGPYVSNRIQVGGYALAQHQAGHRVDWVVWLYLDRASGEDRPVVEPFGPQLIADVLRRVWRIQQYRDAPDHAPRTERGPGLSWSCDACPWLRRCWGAGAAPGRVGPQRLFARNVPAVEAAITEYIRCRDAISDLEKEKEFYAAVFTSGSRPGTYGDWKWYRSRDGDTPDGRAMERRLDELGEEIPRKPKRGSLQVRPS